MKKILLVLTVLAVSGCQTTSVTPAMQKELDAKASYAGKKFSECGFKAVSKFDDGVSPAYVISRAIGKYCSDYAAIYADASYHADGGDFDREYFYELLVNKTFTDTVLLHRTEKLKKK